MSESSMPVPEVFEHATFPMADARVYQTAQGTLFLREPGLAIVSRPLFCPTGAFELFASKFDNSHGFEAAAEDDWDSGPDSDMLAKFAGQLCYMSFGKNRTPNAQTGLYLSRIKEQGHGSVLEHANISILIWGVDRSFTHEMVRHRAGFAYSQVSQRYVDGTMLRFVERPEFQDDPKMEAVFVDWIDKCAEQYEIRRQRLLALQTTGSDQMSAESKTEARKKVNQAARACLPNETEAPILVTGNARAWRHFIEMRASIHSDRPIREVAVRAHNLLSRIAPNIFGDYSLVQLMDGSSALSTTTRKV